VKTDLHDRLLRASYWHFGAGANYALTESLDLSFSYVTYLAGKDTHFGRGITIGTSWNFNTRHPKAFSKTASPARDGTF
jgi:long-subunit fatty acid transport protein